MMDTRAFTYPWKGLMAVLFMGLGLVACGSDSATVGQPEPVTASGQLAVSGTAATALTTNGLFRPNKGALIQNTGEYTLKFDDTHQAINLIYSEFTDAKSQMVYQLDVSQLWLQNTWQIRSVGTPIPNIVVDKAQLTLTLSQVTLTGSPIPDTLILDGMIQIQ